MFEILTKVTCGNITGIPAKLPKLSSEIFTLIEIAIPVLLVIMGTIDMIKGITANKEDEIVKGRKMFVSRLIVGVIIFFIFVIVKTTVNFLDSDNSANIIDCMECFINNKCSVDNSESKKETTDTNTEKTDYEQEQEKIRKAKEEQERIRKEQEKIKKEQEEAKKLDSNKIGSFTKTYGNVKYFLYAPEGSKKGMPLVIFLHGKGEQNNIAAVKNLAPVTSVINGSVQGSEKFIFLAPASPGSQLWHESGTWGSLINLIDEIVKEYSINTNRIYLTGFSAGGCAVWELVEKYPTKFRAAVPVSCSGNIRTASNFKNTPIYAIAGANETGYVNGMKKSVNAVNNAGGKATFKTIPNAGHVQTQSSYSTKELYKWLLSQ